MVEYFFCTGNKNGVKVKKLSLSLVVCMRKKTNALRFSFGIYGTVTRLAFVFHIEKLLKLPMQSCQQCANCYNNRVNIISSIVLNLNNIFNGSIFQLQLCLRSVHANGDKVWCNNHRPLDENYDGAGRQRQTNK